MPKQTTATAPTKLILLGEHTLLYGSRAVSIPMPRMTTVSVRDNPGGGIRVSSSEPLDKIARQRLVRQAKFVMKKLDAGGGIDVKINLTAPPGTGMGVSASVAVALVRAISKHFDVMLPRAKLFEIVEALENMNHGNPSGIDHTTIILNRPVLAETIEGRRRLTPLSDLRQTMPESFYILDTGKPSETTREMVELVAKLYTKAPRKVQRLARAVDASFPGLQKAFRDGRYQELNQIINAAGRVLEQLHVVSKPVVEISNEIRKLGGSAKISGGGGLKNGSGMLIVFMRDRDQLQRLADRYKMRLIPAAG